MTQLLDVLRQKHPRFFYRGYTIVEQALSLKFVFDFEMEPGLCFSPEVVIKGVDHGRISQLRTETLNNIAFHLGLMEIPSYWKAACSPEIVIEAGSLDGYQISWWQDLLIKGMGEFFFVNDIDFTVPDLVTFKIDGRSTPPVGPYDGQLDSNRVLVPIGGGKDSAVTCEILKNANKRVGCLALNPTHAATDTIRASRSEQSITVTRNIDETLLRLNQDGYLNGHTPFSAYLAFLSAACAVLFDYRRIALSNERSSNEGNVNFRGAEINHQYSKSFDFEQRFRDYSERYLGQAIDYFSFLRPIYELQIARLFSQLTDYFPLFRSCNRGQKTNSWCHACPKCLFVYTALYPFVETHLLTTSIFSEDLFEREELIEIALSLLGQGAVKPFECVGSFEETLVAFYLCLRKASRPLPPVLRAVEEQTLATQQNMAERTSIILDAWDSQHAIPPDLEGLLMQEMRS
jgi:hypothetical protein